MNTTLMKQDAIDTTIAAVGSKATYAGATSATVGWVMSSEFGVLAGLLIGFLGLLTNLHFQHRRDRREEKEHQRKMDKLESRRGDLS